jgi:hypothetical protein
MLESEPKLADYGGFCKGEFRIRILRARIFYPAVGGERPFPVAASIEFLEHARKRLYTDFLASYA